jgi:hypothetical protein
MPAKQFVKVVIIIDSFGPLSGYMIVIGNPTTLLHFVELTSASRVTDPPHRRRRTSKIHPQFRRARLAGVVEVCSDSIRYAGFHRFGHFCASRFSIALALVTSPVQFHLSAHTTLHHLMYASCHRRSHLILYSQFHCAF